MKWAIISSLVLNFARHAITSPVPADSIPYKKYVKGDTYSQPQLQEIIVDALELNLRLGFQGVTGHFEIDISFAVAGTYAVLIFTSESLLKHRKGIKRKLSRKNSNPELDAFTLTLELETMLSKSMYEIVSTTIHSPPANSTTSFSSSEETRSITAAFLTNQSNHINKTAYAYSPDISITATSAPRGKLSGPSTILFSISTSAIISHNRLVQAHTSETKSSSIDVIKILNYYDSTTASDASFPIASTDNIFNVPTESEKHDDSMSTLNDLPVITVNSTGTYTVYSCAKEAIWCPSTMPFPLILTKTIAEHTAIDSSLSSPVRAPTIHTVSAQPPPLSPPILPFYFPPSIPPKSPTHIPPSAPPLTPPSSATVP
ncbi:hypothetical protein BOTCAL_0306g00070 [Botryotinia calthae]|uniref:Uncharacterized protein n=1 Tax=Botryotinia calthae TaxID=38488 RepID=A0A4Y8CU68_9HELO|nr:hypothetical protein BOTCAL_0306g00070 [Botryotinia calthae]